MPGEGHQTARVGVYLITAAILAVFVFAKIGLSHAQTAVSPDQTAQINPEEDGEFSAFDILVGGKYFGVAYGFFGEDWVAFEIPEDILDILPALQNKQAILPLFQGIIRDTRTINGVGTLQIFPSEFKVELTVDREQALHQGVAPLAALPPPENAFSVRNKSVLAGSTPINENPDFGNLTYTHETAIGRGATRFSAFGSASQAADYEITEAALQHDLVALGQQMTLSGGMLQTEGQRFARSLDIYGLRLSSNEIFLDRDSLLQGSRIEVFLPSRARVEVFRDTENGGRTLYSGVHDFGTLEINTRAFPPGSYDVEIVITEINGGVTRETRPFTKSRNLAARGRPELYMAAGVTRTDTDLTSSPAIQTGIRARLTGSTEFGASFYATDDVSVFEAGTRGEFNFQSFGMIETTLTGGVTSRGDFSGAEASVLWTGEDYSARVAVSRSNDFNVLAQQDGNIALSERKALNVNFSGPLEFISDRARFSFSGQWDESATGGSTYRYGPDIRVPLYDDRSLIVDLKTEYQVTDADNRLLASLTMRRGQGAWNQSGQIELQSSEPEEVVNSNIDMRFDGEQSDYKDWRRNLKTMLGFQFRPLFSSEDSNVTTFLSANARYQGRWANVDAFFDKNLAETGGRTGGTLTSTVLWSSEGFMDATGQNFNPENALVVVELAGDGGAEFEVLLNGQTKGYVRPGGRAVLDAPIYEVSTVSVQQADEKGFYHIDNPSARISAYPGNIFRRSFTARRMILVFGRLVDEAGMGLDSARLKTPYGVFYTDREGYFNMEAAARRDTPLILELSGWSCPVSIQATQQDEIVYEAGDITCTQNATPHQ